MPETTPTNPDSTTTESSGATTSPDATAPATEAVAAAEVSSDAMPAAETPAIDAPAAAAEQPPMTTDAAAAGASTPPAQPRVVYLETPAPPRKKGNRLVGGAVALLGGGAFAAALAIAMFLIVVIVPGSQLGIDVGFGAYTASAYFWVPVLFFTLGFVVLSLILNRGGWWLYVLFSIVVAAFTYFASIGVLLLLERVIFMTAAQADAAFWAIALDPRLIVAALLAREVSLWMGLATAARGRRVRARNAERHAAFEQELAAKKAEHERAATAAS